MANAVRAQIVSINVKDIRFPTSSSKYGSDAMHTDADYSCAYVIIGTDRNITGYGMTFTIGRGTEIVICAINSLSHIIMGKQTADIFQNFSHYWRLITSEPQLRWLGPEKGVIHLATAAIFNALWDLWARIENKPVWKLLVDMDPKSLISTIDFRYISDVLTPDDAIRMLLENRQKREEREEYMRTKGYPAYTTDVGWIGYSDDLMKDLTEKYMDAGFRGFKIKVGTNLQNDIRRCTIMRDVIGYDNYLMIDANQMWDVDEAVTWVTELAKFKPYWIEEPTSPDDILGHLKISNELNVYGIKVASGEMCSNRILFKQLLQSSAIQICQIDSCRLGSINEILPIYMIAKKFNVPVCPHAGGVGLCEMVQHMQMFDFISLNSGIRPGQFIEYVDHEHEHFATMLNIIDGCYVAPKDIGYSVRFKDEVLRKYEFPTGTKWQSSISN